MGSVVFVALAIPSMILMILALSVLKEKRKKYRSELLETQAKNERIRIEEIEKTKTEERKANLRIPGYYEDILHGEKENRKELIDYLSDGGVGI